MCNSFGVYFQLFKTFRYKKLKNSELQGKSSTKHRTTKEKGVQAAVHTLIVKSLSLSRGEAFYKF